METNPLSITSLVNIFFKSVGAVFILIIVSFAVKACEFKYIYFFFYFHYSRKCIEKMLLWFMPESILPIFSCRVSRHLVLMLGKLDSYMWKYEIKSFSNSLHNSLFYNLMLLIFCNMIHNHLYSFLYCFSSAVSSHS